MKGTLRSWLFGKRGYTTSDVNKETELMTINYLGEEAAKKMLPETLKAKHVLIEVIPEKVLSQNI